MRCADASQLMDEVLDGRVNSERQAALLAHTADCVACRAEWSAIQQIDRLLATAPSVSPPANFSAQVMAHLPRRRPAQNPWAGAIALFAGTIVLLLLTSSPFISMGLTADSEGLMGIGSVALLQIGSTLIRWLEAGWGIRQAILSLIPTGLIALYILLSLVAAVIWLGLIAGVQNALRPASIRET